MEMMGVHLPAAAFVHPYTDLREALTRYAAGHLARGIKNGTIKPLGEMLTEKSFINALIGLMATGGSTNHTMHLVAMAPCCRRDFELGRLRRNSSIIPLLIRVYPTAKPT